MVAKALIFSLPLLVSVSTHNVYAKKKNRPTPSNRPCETLKLCADLVSKTLNQKYIFNKELKGKIFLTENFTVNKTNAEQVFSEALRLNGLARVKIADGTYRIIHARDIRYHPVDIINVPNYNTDVIPNLSDYFMVNLSLMKHEYPSEISRNLRPFVSRYGRIISVEGNKEIIIQDTGHNLKRLVKLVSKLDRKLNDDEVEAIKDAQKYRRKREKNSYKEVKVPKK